jgi:hypothetical protein
MKASALDSEASHSVGSSTSANDSQQELAIEDLRRRVVESNLAQARLQDEHKRARIGLQQQIDELTNKLRALENEKGEPARQRPEDVAKILELQATIELMAASKFWRIGTAYWALRSRLLEAITSWRHRFDKSQLQHARPRQASSMTGRENAPLLIAPEPLFVIGCARSGTTLVAKILDAHPDVLMTNETAVFLMLAHIIENSRIGYAAGILYGKEHSHLWAEHLMQNARSLIEGYYDRIRTESKKRYVRYWGEKHPHHSECFDFINALYPAAKYIYVIRDPRDAACSIADMNRIDFAEGLAIWKTMSDANEAFVSRLRPQRVWRVRYEDLVNDYLSVTEQMLGWLGLQAAPVADYVAKIANLDAHTLLQSKPRKADFRASSVSRWRRQLSAAQQRFAVELVGDFLQQYGYEC